MTLPSGYETKTTFFDDFTIADHFGIPAIKDTYNRAFADWKDDTTFITELCMVLNWKIWEWYEKNERIARVYNDLWDKLACWCEKNLKGADLEYYYRVTD